MSEKKKPTMTSASALAVAAVLEKQKGTPRWDNAAHTAGLGFLAESIALKEGKFDRLAFMTEIANEPGWLYASNMKKKLIELGDIEDEKKTVLAEYV